MRPHDVEDLMERKVDVCFGHVDQNEDGVFDATDSMALTERVISCLGEPSDSPKARRLRAAVETFREHVAKDFDTNADGLVTIDEWRAGMTRAFAGEATGFDDGFKPWAEALWDLCDKNGDGLVDEEEFSLFHQAFRMSPGQSRVAFEHLDRNHDGSISVDELLEACREYYTSSDPDAPGNWLYGDIWDETIWEGSKVRL